jgi:hypothetical protein
VYPLRQRVRRPRQAPDRRRPDRPENPGRLDDHPGTTTRSPATFASASRKVRAWSPVAWSARRACRRTWPRAVHPAHGVRRCEQPHAHRPGRDLRPGGVPDPVQGRGRGAATGQRHRVRPGLVHLDPGHRQGASSGPGHRGRHGVHQQPERARPASAVRWGEGFRHWPRRRQYSFEVFAEIKNVCISMGSHHIPRWGV